VTEKFDTEQHDFDVGRLLDDAPRRQEFDEAGRGYWRCPELDKRGDSAAPENIPDTEQRDPAMKDEANLVSSLCFDGQHRPVLDFDIPARYVPSTTPGHGHLYIDVPMSWEKYEAVLIALRDAGVLETGYVGAACRRKATFVRPEWVKKESK